MDTHDDASTIENHHAKSNQSVANLPSYFQIETISLLTEKLGFTCRLNSTDIPQTEEGYASGFSMSSHSRRTDTLRPNKL